jgi:hypothetical protein
MFCNPLDWLWPDLAVVVVTTEYVPVSLAEGCYVCGTWNIAVPKTNLGAGGFDLLCGIYADEDLAYWDCNQHHRGFFISRSEGDIPRSSFRGRF